MISCSRRNEKRWNGIINKLSYLFCHSIRWLNFLCVFVFTKEPTTDVRNLPISEKYNSLKEYLDSEGKKISWQDYLSAIMQ